MRMLLRADANTEIGTGHVMRCIALAQAYRAAGGECSFVSAELPAALARRLEDEQFGNIALAARPGGSADAQEFGTLADACNPSWLVVDGYHFPQTYYEAVKSFGHRLAVIDDLARLDGACADIVVRPNPVLSASASIMDQDREDGILSGAEYILLRQEFIGNDGAKQSPQIARRLLVSLGGGDPSNVTATILRGLDAAVVDGGDLIIVAGAANPHVESLLARKAAKQWKTVVKQNVRNMAPLMAWADLAIAAAGGTAWELAVMGVPALLVSLADNQLDQARFLHEHRAAIHLGSAQQLTVEAIARAASSVILDQGLRCEMAQHARKLVDGGGAERVVRAMLNMEAQEAIPVVSIRKADLHDARRIWEWVNDPQVRAMSFSPDTIAWESHLSWMTRKLDDPLCRLYVGLDGRHEPVGEIRFDIRQEDDSATLSIVIDPNLRGKGFGNSLTRTAAYELFRSTKVSRIEALVKPENASSLSLFRKAGFAEVGKQVIK